METLRDHLRLFKLLATFHPTTTAMILVTLVTANRTLAQRFLKRSHRTLVQAPRGSLAKPQLGHVNRFTTRAIENIGRLARVAITLKPAAQADVTMMTICAMSWSFAGTRPTTRENVYVPVPAPGKPVPVQKVTFEYV